jgi:D-3-phosphoglycerate dehydrogenase
MKPRVVFTDPHQHVFEQELLALLENLGATYEARRCQTDQEVIDLCQDADAIMTSQAVLSRTAIESFEKCRHIARVGTGYDNIDHVAAGEHGITVTNVPAFCTDEVASHAVLLGLACDRKLVYLDQQLRQGHWRQFDLCESSERLDGRLFGVVGFGAIGQAAARRAAAFGMRILFYDPFFGESPADLTAEKCDSLQALLEQADFVSLHTALTAESRHLIGPQEFQQMKSTAILINTARGPVVDQDALITALKTGQIAAAGLDVFNPEPVPQECPLLKMDNVVLSPHTAAHTRGSLAELRQRTVEEVMRILQGEPPLHVVNTPWLKSAGS